MTKGELEKENAELKERNAELKGMYAHSAREAGTYKQFLELKEKEIAELKAEIKNNEDLATVAYMQGAERQKQKDASQLDKAKEIMKKFSEFVNNRAEYDPEHQQEYTDLWYELCELAEQFLKEVENDTN